MRKNKKSENIWFKHTCFRRSNILSYKASTGSVVERLGGFAVIGASSLMAETTALEVYALVGAAEYGVYASVTGSSISYMSSESSIGSYSISAFFFPLREFGAALTESPPPAAFFRCFGSFSGFGCQSNTIFTFPSSSEDAFGPSCVHNQVRIIGLDKVRKTHLKIINMELGSIEHLIVG